MGPGVLTPPFPRVDGELRCAGVRLTELAERWGTPLYVYDLDHIDARFRVVRDAFAGVDALVAYSVKANGNLALLARLARLGAGADIVSGGELHLALKAGIPPQRIVFAGVAKTEAEMRTALDAGIYAFNVESRGELERLDGVASEMGVSAPFAVRVNPDILSPTPHEYTRTGHAESKFGVPSAEAFDLYAWAKDRPSLRALGIDVHIGSQILDPEPYGRAADRVLALVDELAASGIFLEFLDIGGGFGVRYGAADEPTPVVQGVADLLLARLMERGLRVILEPGRFIVAEAGVLLTRVEYVKRTPDKTFVIVDGGMTELIRPSHYGGYHEVEPVLEASDTTPETEHSVDIVGPICETGDFLARGRVMSVPEPGALLVVRASGAYGFAMASNYNARRRPAQAAVSRGRAWLVRERETFDDLTRGESIPPELLDPDDPD